MCWDERLVDMVEENDSVLMYGCRSVWGDVTVEMCMWVLFEKKNELGERTVKGW